jgi:hypothetical protein
VDLLVYGEIRYGPFEPSIFGFQFLEALGLVNPHAAVSLRQR